MNLSSGCAFVQAKEAVKKLTEKLQSRDLETRPGRTMLETFEDEVNQALNKARDDSGKEAQRSLASTNNVVRMVSAGSKGSFINISQVRWGAPALILPIPAQFHLEYGFCRRQGHLHPHSSGALPCLAPAYLPATQVCFAGSSPGDDSRDGRG